jgi:hypothetical protein
VQLGFEERVDGILELYLTRNKRLIAEAPRGATGEFRGLMQVARPRSDVPPCCRTAIRTVLRGTPRRAAVRTSEEAWRALQSPPSNGLWDSNVKAMLPAIADYLGGARAATAQAINAAADEAVQSFLGPHLEPPPAHSSPEVISEPPLGPPN